MPLLANLWIFASIYIGWLQRPFLFIAVLGLVGAIIESNIRFPNMHAARVRKPDEMEDGEEEQRMPERRIEHFARRLLENLLITAGLYIAGYGARYLYIHYL